MKKLLEAFNIDDFEYDDGSEKLSKSNVNKIIDSNIAKVNNIQFVWQKLYNENAPRGFRVIDSTEFNTVNIFFHSNKKTLTTLNTFGSFLKYKGWNLYSDNLDARNHHYSRLIYNMYIDYGESATLKDCKNIIMNYLEYSSNASSIIKDKDAEIEYLYESYKKLLENNSALEILRMYMDSSYYKSQVPYIHNSKTLVQTVYDFGWSEDQGIYYIKFRYNSMYCGIIWLSGKVNYNALCKTAVTKDDLEKLLRQHKITTSTYSEKFKKTYDENDEMKYYYIEFSQYCEIMRGKQRQKKYYIPSEILRIYRSFFNPCKASIEKGYNKYYYKEDDLKTSALQDIVDKIGMLIEYNGRKEIKQYPDVYFLSPDKKVGMFLYYTSIPSQNTDDDNFVAMHNVSGITLNVGGILVAYFK